MLFIQKSALNLARFNAALNGNSNFEDLSASGLDRDNVKLILLNEQGCLCPFCERRLEIGTATIEHFLPKSVYAHIEVNYYNLFACCHLCNQRKGDHLIPPYIFDVRLNCLDINHLIISRHNDFKSYYEMSGNECHLINTSLSKYPKKLDSYYHSISIFYNTLELLNLNESEKFSKPRKKILITMITQLEHFSNNKIISLFKSYLTMQPKIIGQVQYSHHEEYLSLILYTFAKTLRKRGIDLQTI